KYITKYARLFLVNASLLSFTLFSDYKIYKLISRSMMIKVVNVIIVENLHYNENGSKSFLLFIYRPNLDFHYIGAQHFFSIDGLWGFLSLSCFFRPVVWV
ncbi:hypothetical protein ACJX0J_032216, partial [Zea mays]